MRIALASVPWLCPACDPPDVAETVAVPQPGHGDGRDRAPAGGGDRGLLSVDAVAPIRGDGVQPKSLVPVPRGHVPLQLALGGSHSCVRFANGQASCSGLNSLGQLGLVGQAARKVFTQVPWATGAAQLVAGRYFTCARDPQGSVRCVGDEGQLGNAPPTGGSEPVTVPVGGVVDLSAGPNHACALTGKGQVHCWGANAAGQLGDGWLREYQLSPVVVDGLAGGVRTIAAGGAHTCALFDDGAVGCWGMASFGQCGASGQAVLRQVQRQLETVKGRRGKRGRPGHSAAVRGAVPSGMPSPLHSVDGLGPVAAIAAGGFHTCALDHDRRLLCFGRNHRGQLGDGTFDDRARPLLVELPDADPVRKFALGAAHTVLCTARGQLFSFGDNAFGQLGRPGLPSRRSLPYRVELPERCVDVAAGQSHTCVSGASGRLYCFGQNDGQLGDGTVEARDRPVLAIGDLERR